MKRMTVPEEGIETLFGSYDENLKHLESLFNVRIRTQGHDLIIEGESPNIDKVDRVVGQLSSLMRDGYKLSNADVKTASMFGDSPSMMRSCPWVRMRTLKSDTRCLRFSS